MHYYNAGSKNAAFVFDAATKTFEFFSEGTETDGLFSGTYGTIKAANTNKTTLKYFVTIQS
jgi:hypothetical protein